jgi:hypothetical protein
MDKSVKQQENISVLFSDQVDEGEVTTTLKATADSKGSENRHRRTRRMLTNVSRTALALAMSFGFGIAAAGAADASVVVPVGPAIPHKPASCQGWTGSQNIRRAWMVSDTYKLGTGREHDQWDIAQRAEVCRNEELATVPQLGRLGHWA